MDKSLIKYNKQKMASLKSKMVQKSQMVPKLQMAQKSQMVPNQMTVHQLEETILNIKKNFSNDSTINIAILGAVSAGKSTLLNCLFVNQYSDMHIKRTTTMPQVYTEVNSNIPKDELKKIREQNREINNKFMNDTANGNKLSYEQIQEINYSVPKVYDLIELNDGTNLCIFDLPGLNDSMTKNVYHKYVENNFYKFDIVIFLVDVYDALNTSDEIDVLKMILTNTKLNKEKYDINTRLIIMLNKCDEMEIINNECIPDDEELKEMVNQAKNIINTKKQEIYNNATIDILCVSCEDAYIYRMYSRDPNEVLDVKYINKFGSNEYGKKRWNKLDEQQKKKEIVRLFKNFNYDDRIEQCGFKNFKAILNKILTKNNQYDMILNHLKYDMNKFMELFKKHNNVSILKDIETLKYFEIRLKNIQLRYEKNNDISLVHKYIDEFIKDYELQQKKYIDKYDISSDTDYDIMKTITKCFNTFMHHFSMFNKDCKNNISNISSNMYNYLVNQVNQNNKFGKSLEYIHDLKNNDYDSSKLEKLIEQKFSNIINLVDINEEFNKSTFETIIIFDNLMVNKLKLLSEFLLTPDKMIILIINNIYNYIYYMTTHQSFQEDWRYNLLSKKISYLSNIYIDEHNKYYTYVHAIINYMKNCLPQSIYNKIFPIRSDIIKSDNNIKSFDHETLEIHLINLLSKTYPDDITSMSEICVFIKESKKKSISDKKCTVDNLIFDDINNKDFDMNNFMDLSDNINNKDFDMNNFIDLSDNIKKSINEEDGTESSDDDIKNILGNGSDCSDESIKKKLSTKNIKIVSKKKATQKKNSR